MHIFAITTRGLEALSAEEMAELAHLQIKESAYRRVSARYEGPLAALLSLRVVDDVYLELGAWTGIVRQRESLERIRDLSAKLDLYRAADVLARLRPVGEHPSFSVTASFVGKRNYNADEIKKAAADGISVRFGWVYQENDQPGALNIRVFIEHEQAFVGIRLSDYPMHQRPYKQAHIFGSTKPSVAAALVRLAQIPAQAAVLDPCCGAGTILIEAAYRSKSSQSGAKIIGGDLDPEAVAASRVNLGGAGVSADIQEWDARKLPLPDHSVDRIITNLPWGRQVRVETDLATDYQAICGEMNRVLTPGGRIVLLANEPQYVTMDGVELITQLEISLFGQNPKILVFEDSSR